MPYYFCSNLLIVRAIYFVSSLLYVPTVQAVVPTHMRQANIPACFAEENKGLLMFTNILVVPRLLLAFFF